MIKRLDKETLDFFVNVLNNVDETRMVRLKNDLEKVYDGRQGYNNLGVQKASVTRRKFEFSTGEGEETKTVEEFVQGIAVTGYDHDDEKIMTVFNPHLAYLEVYYPELPKEPGLGEVIGDLVGGIAMIFGGAPEEEEDREEYHFDILDEPGIETGESHKENVAKLKKAITKDPSLISADDYVVDLVFNRDIDYYDLLVTDVAETPDGVIVGFKDLADYQGVDKEEVRLRLLNGQTDLPTPNGDFYFLMKNLKEVNLRTPQAYASKRLMDGNVDITTTKMQEQPYY